MLDSRSIFLVRKRIFPLTIRTPVDDAGGRSGSGTRAAAVDSRGGEPRWWWSAGRRSAPEAGGSRKRIVLWRAPRPQRGRGATSVGVAWRTTPAPPGAPLGTRVAFRANGFSWTWLWQNSDARASRERKRM